MAAQIECNQLDAVIFLRDPVETTSMKVDYDRITVLCDTNNIPVATNIATAEILILAIERGDLSWRDLYK